MTDANLAANLKQEVLTAIDHWERNTGSMDFLLCDYLVPVVAKMIHDRTAALEAENAKLRAALQVFADEAYKHDPDEYDGDDLVWDCDLKIGDLRRAREAMKGQNND